MHQKSESNCVFYVLNLHSILPSEAVGAPVCGVSMLTACICHQSQSVPARLFEYDWPTLIFNSANLVHEGFWRAERADVAHNGAHRILHNWRVTLQYNVTIGWRSWMGWAIGIQTDKAKNSKLLELCAGASSSMVRSVCIYLVPWYCTAIPEGPHLIGIASNHSACRNSIYNKMSVYMYGSWQAA